MRVSQNRGGPYDKDYSTKGFILGSILGSPYLGKLPSHNSGSIKPDVTTLVACYLFSARGDVR